MKSTTQPNELSIDCGLDRQRDIIRKSLDAIANDVSMALRDAGLAFPVCLTVPSSGDSLATIATWMTTGGTLRESPATSLLRGWGAANCELEK